MDDDLVGRARNGDRKALEQLLETYLVAVYRYVSARLGSADSAVEDVVQETLIGAMGSIHRLREAMARLTPDQREVLTLKFSLGNANDEIAGMIGKPVGSVKSLQHRALAALARLVTGPGPSGTELK